MNLSHIEADIRALDVMTSKMDGVVIEPFVVRLHIIQEHLIEILNEKKEEKK